MKSSKEETSFCVPLRFAETDVQQYRSEERNVIRLRIQLPDGEMIDSPRCRVELTLSRDAMLGFGSALIRAAIGEDASLMNWHLHPAEEGFSSEALGVFLHPLSCEFLIGRQEMGTLEEILRRVERGEE